MNRWAFLALSAVWTGLVALAATGRSAPDDASPMRDIPPGFAPLEYLVGNWKGQGVPRERTAQQFRGWTETHSWAWIFAGGKPVALSVTIGGGRIFTSGKLTFDDARKRYRLDATPPKPGEPRLSLEGALDSSGKLLILDGGGNPGEAAGKIRLSLRPNANFIRYTMTVDRQEPGAVRFSRTMEVGLTKEGESLAGGATASERPKCIVTGGAATLTVSYQGQTFPICCTGCRDEFNENPEKYIKKASLMRQAPAGPARTAPSRVSRFEDAFAKDVDDAKADPGQTSDKGTSGKSNHSDANAPAASKSGDSKSAGKAEAVKTTADPAARAASVLRQGQNLEKSGNTKAALEYYRRVVKDFAKTPSAKTAAARIKALDQ